MTCEHKYVPNGVRYALGTGNRPGSGAVNVYYAHAYVCEKCLDKRFEPIPFDWDHRPSSYEKIRYDATPGKPSEVGVPLEDRR